MKKITVLLIVLLCALSSNVAISKAQSIHNVSCVGSHQDFVMVDESSDDFDTNADRQICGGYWGSSKTKIALFPSHTPGGTALTTIKPLEGGFAGIFYISEDSQLELIIIPDTYCSISYLAPLGGNLQYVSLPNNDSFSVSERDELMFNEHLGLTFLVVEGSAAHEYCQKNDLPYAFREEYCHYINDSGTFDSIMFHQAFIHVPNIITPREKTNQADNSTVVAKSNTDILATEPIYPYIEGTLWGYLDAEGNIFLHPQYSSANTGNAGIYIVSAGQYYGLIDSNGMSRLPMEYDSVEYIADNVYLAKMHKNSFIVHPFEGDIIDVSTYSDVFHLGDGLLQYFEKVRTPAGIEYYTGLLGYDGTILCEPADASYVHYPERGLIGISYSGKTAGAKIIDYTGKAYVDFVAGGCMMPTVEVPIMQISSGNVVTETVVYFEGKTHRLKTANGLRHCGAIEGYIDAAGNFYPINREPENSTQVYIAFAQKNDSNNVIIFSNGHQVPYEVFTFPQSQYGSYTNCIQVLNGYGIVSQKYGVPFYVTTDLHGRDIIDTMNNMIFAFTHENQYKHIALHSINTEGIAIAEVLNSDGSHGFRVATLHPSQDDEKWYNVVTQTRHGNVCFISPYKYGYAVVYNEAGKAGIVDAHGTIFVDMVYDQILLYPDYAVAITGKVQSQDAFVYSYGHSEINNNFICTEGMSKIVFYKD